MNVIIQRADWASFEQAMGEKGGCGGCWCMLWRLPKKQMDAQMGEANRQAMKGLFEQGAIPGLIATDDGKPIGWIQIDRRSEFIRLENSRNLKPVDDNPVWSVSCFFIHKHYRKMGISSKLLRAACDHVKDCGGSIIEGYPIDTPNKKYPPVYAWTGFYQAFVDAGFMEVARRSETRPIMRKTLA